MVWSVLPQGVDELQLRVHRPTPGIDPPVDISRNDDPQLFMWTKTADDIITKVKRARATIDRVADISTHPLCAVLARLVRRHAIRVVNVNTRDRRKRRNPHGNAMKRALD